MKKKFSSAWVGSKLPRKQVKYRANAPMHLRRKMISANFSKELRKKYQKRNFPIRKGDKVIIMRGEFQGKSGLVENINMKKMKVTIENIYKTKKDGSKYPVKFDPSKLQIISLNLNDKKRISALDRKASIEKKIDIKVKKLPKSKNKNKEDKE